jgi:hypothetical protein
MAFNGSGIPFILSLQDAVRGAIIKRAGEIAEEEIAAASLRVRSRIDGEIDALALSVLGYYAVEETANHLKITVKKRDEVRP